MTIHNQYHPAALQKFVSLPKIPKMIIPDSLFVINLLIQDVIAI